ncbi:hypothetical protein [Jannaschia sp. LMIT008]|uniref:hypothetical protein n=1 Tax=Jannaschia maritima TaxID=3032585 RepID=UPI002811AE81|nr:hypothetical protein [Jannaschia sp. LMIT008]
MVRMILAAAMAALLAVPAAAQTFQGQSVPQMRLVVDRELPRHGFRDVDVRDLSTNQVVQIYGAVTNTTRKSAAERQAIITSALGRGLFGTVLRR